MTGLCAFACFGISTALLIAAASAFRRRRRFAKRAKPCAGRVLSAERATERSAAGNRGVVYLLCVAYEVGAQPYTVTLKLTAKPKYRPDSEIPLLVDENEPQHIMLAFGEGDRKNTWGLTLLALAFVSFGTWLVKL